MKRVYQFVTAPSPQPVQILSVYTIEFDGQLIGLLTDPPSTVLGHPIWNQETKMLHHVGSVTKTLLDNQLRAQTGLPSDALEDLTDIVLAAPTGTTTVMVNDTATLARTIRLNGLELALADDLDTDYYAIARPAGLAIPWPALHTLP